MSIVPASFSAAIASVDAAMAAMAAEDAGPFRACWADTPDSTLMGAFGTVERGRENIDATLKWVAHRFAGGALQPSYDVICVDGNLGYTVALERGHTFLDKDSDSTELLIRVTHIYRHYTGLGWELIYRHADHPPALSETPRLTRPSSPHA